VKVLTKGTEEQGTHRNTLWMWLRTLGHSRCPAWSGIHAWTCLP
jgi:hypothetical protein